MDAPEQLDLPIEVWALSFDLVARSGADLPLFRGRAVAALRLVCRAWAAVLNDQDYLGWYGRKVGAGHLERACRFGWLASARWLARAFRMTAADARAADNVSLRRACEEGHLDVAVWLAGTFGLTAADARATGPAEPKDSESASSESDDVHWSYGANHWELVAKRPSLCRRPCYALRKACQNGHLPTARWLVESLGLTADDAHDCRSAHEETEWWLVDLRSR
jgi:hypothetical protein